MPACTTCAGGGPAAALETALRSLLKAGATALSKQALHGLRTRRRLSLSFKAPAAGTLTVKLLVHSAVLAKAHHTFAAPGRATLALALTAAGRKQLAHAHALRGTLTVSFLPRGAKRGTSLHTAVALH
jgi:hypothetical protein